MWKESFKNEFIARKTAMGDTLDVAQAHRQQRLGAIQGLDLRFLVNAEHECLVGRVEVEPDDVSYLLDLTEALGRACRRHWKGSLESLEPSDFRAAVEFLAVRLQRKVCSQRWAVLFEMPVAAAKERAVHCVLPSVGLLCRARLITSTTLSSS